MSATSPAQILDIADSGSPWFDAVHSTTCLFRLGRFRKELERDNASQATLVTLLATTGFKELIALHRMHVSQMGSLSTKAMVQAIGNSALAIGDLYKFAPDLERTCPVLAVVAADTLARVRRDSSGLNGGSTRYLSNVLYGLKDVKRYESVDKVFASIARELTLEVRNMNQQDIGNSVLAFGARCVRPGDFDKFLNTVADSANKDLHNFTAQHLSNTAYGFAKCGVKRTEFMKDLGDAFAQQIDSAANANSHMRLASPSPHSLANTMYAFAIFGIYHERIIRAAARAVVTWDATSFGEMDLAEIIWAFARLGFKDAPVMSVAAKRGQELLPKMSNWGVCVMLWSFRELGFQDDFSAFTSKVGAEIQSRGLSKGDVERSHSGPVLWNQD
ncbi:unnamed protein product [Polarella glacialis]|uniref:RNA-editing substrate-binding complex 6 protein domain-containing protein n=1 Tax=Polarella glacialis TaxID=89957 RepID=A0A813ID23_POLGL|nr:unnamed protein product [Polarella glacialis]CAE8648610.1 unnamed protein product [Polarella glacialis]